MISFGKPRHVFTNVLSSLVGIGNMARPVPAKSGEPQSTSSLMRCEEVGREAQPLPRHGFAHSIAGDGARSRKADGEKGMR